MDGPVMSDPGDLRQRFDGLCADIRAAADRSGLTAEMQIKAFVAAAMQVLYRGEGGCGGTISPRTRDIVVVIANSLVDVADACAVSAGDDGRDRGSIGSRLLTEAAAVFGTSVPRILSARQDRATARARQAVCFVLGEVPHWSLPRIGRFLNRDHTTVLYSIAKARAVAATNPEFAAKLREVRTRARVP